MLMCLGGFIMVLGTTQKGLYGFNSIYDGKSWHTGA